jgi:NAD+ synthase
MLVDAKKTKDDIVQWIREYFDNNGKDCSAVIGISGGKDSSIVAALCVEALGADRVVGVMMPNGLQKDIADSQKLIECLGIHGITVNIGWSYNNISEMIGNALSCGLSDQAKINIPPRLRMTTLYAVAQSLPNGGRVANTCNRSEDFVGYATKFGDTAGDFSPLANLMVHEVVQIGHELPIPAELVDKVPSDGLCGKTDEDNLGVSYAEIDRYIESGSCAVAAHEHHIEDMHRKNLHKLNPMPSFGAVSRG